MICLNRNIFPLILTNCYMMNISWSVSLIT